MVKPEILWAYAKTSQDGDELFLGKLLRHLAGHKVELSATERLAANALMQSNEWHTENVETKKERDALYQRINRLERLLKEHGIEIPKKSKSANDCQIDIQCQIDNSKSISLPHSPTHSPTHSPKKESVCVKSHTHTSNFDFESLTEADAIKAGAAAGLPKDVAMQAFAELKANGGGYTSRGVFVKVTGENFQNTLRTLARHIKPSSPAAKVTARKPTAKEIKSAMELCAENCAAFVSGKCSKGYKVWPSLRERQIPPNECHGYVKIANGGDK